MTVIVESACVGVDVRVSVAEGIGVFVKDGELLVVGVREGLDVGTPVRVTVIEGVMEGTGVPHGSEYRSTSVLVVLKLV